MERNFDVAVYPLRVFEAFWVAMGDLSIASLQVVA